MKAYSFLLSAGLLLAGTQCKKETSETVVPDSNITTLQIKVVDLHTDAPIPGAVCSFLGSGSDFLLRLGTDTSNLNGELHLEDQEGFSKFQCEITKPGYVSKLYHKIIATPGEVNDYIIQLRPFDAVVKLEVENVQAYPDTLYFKLLNDGALTDAGKTSFLPFTPPILLQPFEKFTANIPALGNDSIKVFWTWNINETGYYLPFRNVVSVPVGDTLVYEVTN